MIKVLLTSSPEAPAWGLKICEEAGLGSGTVYPILERLVEAGWVARTEEVGEHPGRPKRYYYQLTGVGQVAAQRAKESKPRVFGAVRVVGEEGWA
ncbi:PadR family transcriptional regulator [Streptomyces sp. NPDC059989]|uniref:PadR family transcriptional regulator n=1 Tax=Streptomyces sp. NPDC059989 TaxID=3347026 RepID=UPI0036C64288